MSSALPDINNALPRAGTLLRYLHTLRYLRPVQVLARLRRALRHPRADTGPAPAPRPVNGSWRAPVAGTPSLVAPERFRLLNVERDCRVAGDWQPAGADKLWIYNLHYFDDLNARAAASRRAWHLRLLERWVAENAPGAGDAWEPYPVSRRIVNWLKWRLGGGELSAACRQSLAVQARWLRGALEYHLLGNHLLANAKALVYAGLYFAGAEAESWYEHGMRILTRELREQVLPDGGHFERSPMYHATVLEDLLDVLNALRAYGRAAPAEWLAVSARMRRWLQVMTHPDGGIAFFNDAALQIAPSSAELEAFAVRLGLPPAADAREALLALEPSGYVRALAPAACLLCDCAPVGAAYQPGHAHADTLSFELSLGAQRLLVNSGTSRYGTDAERQRERGTAAHNTVVVDGADSSEVWSGFRVGRRARVRLHAAHATDEGALIEASHDGYRRLPGRNRHARQWRLGGQSLRIEDRLSGAFSSAEARFHLHPAVRATPSGVRGVLLRWAEDRGGARLSVAGAAALQVQPSQWYPEFGVQLPNTCVVARFGGDTLVTQLEWRRP